MRATPSSPCTVFHAFALTLRELSELLLIAEAVRIYLRQQGRSAFGRYLVPGMLVGAALAAAAVGWGAVREWSETTASLATIAFAILVMLLTVALLSSFQVIELRTRLLLDRWEERPAMAWAIGLFGAAIALRETLEIGFFLHAIQQSAGLDDALTGAALGATAAALLGLAYRSIRTRINLRAIFRLSTLLMAFLAIELLLGGIDGLLRAHAEPGSAWITAAEPFLQGGRWYAWVCTALMAWPLFALWRRWWTESTRSA